MSVSIDHPSLLSHCSILSHCSWSCLARRFAFLLFLLPASSGFSVGVGDALVTLAHVGIAGSPRALPADHTLRVTLELLLVVLILKRLLVHSAPSRRKSVLQSGIRN